jgi:hypothetical protein
MLTFARRIFIGSSLLFGALGIVIVLLRVETWDEGSMLARLLLDSFLITIFLILPSFAVCVASKYLGDN